MYRVERCSGFAILVFLAGFIWSNAGAQVSTGDSLVIKKIFDEALNSRIAYGHLEHLCAQTGNRQSGSPGLMAAIEYTRQVMQSEGADTIVLQPVMIPNWKPGTSSIVRISSSVLGHADLVCAPLGNSGSTKSSGISAKVIELHGLDELEKLGRDKVKGKIVFFNRPMDPTLINTFTAYGKAVDQRSSGPSLAAEFGAVAVLVRSMTTALDNHAHTGQTRFKDGVAPIPALALSTLASEELSSWLKQEPEMSCYIKTDCSSQPDAQGFNVIGIIKGSQYPNEIITIGGHLDDWFTGEGAQDDGSGCIQGMELIRLYKALGIKPLHTIQVVMFMDEEIRQTGGAAYLKEAQESGKKFILALESDRGGLLPRGFTLDASEPFFSILKSFQPLFGPYGIDEFIKGGSGVDIGPLKAAGTALAGLYTDGQRYFDYHHSSNDVFGNVNIRELQLGSAAMAAFIFLADRHWPDH